MYPLRDGTAPLMGNLKKQVPLTALDDLQVQRPVRFIKMDVEGEEPQVIKGAVRLLREDRPIILSELHPTQLERASGVTANEFLDQLRAIGYRAYTVGPAKAGHHREGQAGHYRDLLGPALDRAPEEALVSVVLVPD